MYFISNASGCPSIAAFPSTLMARNWNLGCHEIAAFLSILIAKQLEPYFLALYNIFLYSQLVFAFLLLKIFTTFKAIFSLFVFFFLQKDFDTFHKHIDAFLKELIIWLAQSFFYLFKNKLLRFAWKQRTFYAFGKELKLFMLANYFLD